MTSPRTRNSRCRRLPETSERGCLQAAEAITFGGSAEMPRLLDMGCALYEPRVDSTVSPKVVRLFCFCCCQQVCRFGVRLFHPNVSFTDSEVLKAATGTGVQRRAATVAAATIRLTKRTNSAATMTKPPTAIPAGSDRPRLEPGTPPLCIPLIQCAHRSASPDRGRGGGGGSPLRSAQVAHQGPHGGECASIYVGRFDAGRASE